MEQYLLRWPAQIVGGLLVIVTLLPLLPTGLWFVRVWDFPRLQIAALLALPLIACIYIAVKTSGSWLYVSWIVVLLAALGWQIAHVLHFSPYFAAKEVQDTSGKDGQSLTKLMVVNLDYENDKHDDVAKQIAAEDPDILLLIEYHQPWREGLSELRDQFNHHEEEVRGEGLGLALWTKVKVLQSEKKHLISDRRVSIWAELELPDGTKANFVGLHPTPPGLKDKTGDERRDSRVRDAELLIVADEVKEHSDEAWIVAGDFNDVAWSHTTRLFKRVSGLNDPRVGRTFMGTYHSEYMFLRFPIDHVFVSDGFELGELRRVPTAGSDHFGVIATLATEPPSADGKPAEGVTPEPAGNDEEEKEEIVEEGKEDAEERNVDD